MADSGSLNSPISTALPQTAQGMPKEIQPYFQEVYDAIYQLQLAFVNFVGVAPQPQSIWDELTASQTIFAQNANRAYLQAIEPIGAGAIVNILNSGGAAKVQNANATNNTKPADGFCNVAAGVGIGDFLEVIMFSGLCTLFSGLTPGQRYFLSTVSGSIQLAAPVAAGNIEQFVGIAMDANSLFFHSASRFVQH